MFKNFSGPRNRLITSKKYFPTLGITDCTSCQIKWPKFCTNSLACTSSSSHLLYKCWQIFKTAKSLLNLVKRSFCTFDITNLPLKLNDPNFILTCWCVVCQAVTCYMNIRKFLGAQNRFSTSKKGLSAFLTTLIVLLLKLNSPNFIQTCWCVVC